MARIVDTKGRELTGSDRGILAMLGVCGNLTYLDKKYIRQLLLPQYEELMRAEGHPLNMRLMELRAMVERDVKRGVLKAKRNMVKPNRKEDK